MHILQTDFVPGDRSQVAEDHLVKSYMGDASELKRIVANLTNFYNAQRQPPSFGMRRVATDRQYDSVSRTWIAPVTLHFRSEHTRSPALFPSATIPRLSSLMAPTANADTGSTPDDVVMEEAVQDEVERDEAAVPEQDEAPSVGQVERSPDTPITFSDDVGGASWNHLMILLLLVP